MFRPRRISLVFLALGMLVNRVSSSSSRVRKLQSTLVDITDATAEFVPSTESTYDHMVDLEDNFQFHWNDLVGDHFQGRLVHKADTMDQAPSWIGFGVYHSNHNYTELPINSFMVGSTAIIGMVNAADTPAPAQHYHLGAKLVDSVKPFEDDTSFTQTQILQHDSDDGTVVTDLSFSKSLAEQDNPQGTLRTTGTNVFLWAIGPPGGTPGVLSQHSQKGVIFLDLGAVQQQIEGNTKPTETDATSAVTESDSKVNTAPVIRGQCGSPLLEGSNGGMVALTPAINFHWRLLGPNKVTIALEYSGREAWLGVATSSNGQMLGSSAVIGIPGSDSEAMTPTHHLLSDKNVAGVTKDPSVVLEEASITSTVHTDDPSKYTTTMKFTRALNDPNDPVPITEGLITFLYAIGASRDLAYHEHREAFRLNLEECGGAVSTSGGGDIWANHGTFAAHGFFAVIAWALATPFAVTVAWFRTLLPASWIYIHVFANSLTFLATMIAFFVAIAGVTKEDGADHFSKIHHWVGLLLFFLATFQVINGFLRPPVERKDAQAANQTQDTFLGIMPIPRTPRETWQLMHRVLGLAAVAMGIYQVQSGLGLYALRFDTNSMVTYYWIYVAVFFVSLIGLKGWVILEENRARQDMVQPISMTEPTIEESPSVPSATII